MELDHDGFMSLALDEAHKGAALGNTFVGAVIGKNGVVIGRGHNTVMSERNPLNHAETVAIANTCRALGTADLSGSTLYSTMEPCPMCLWAIHRAGIRRLVLGGRLASMGRTDLGDYSVEKFLELVHEKMDLITGVRAEECERLRREWGVYPLEMNLGPRSGQPD